MKIMKNYFVVFVVLLCGFVLAQDNMKPASPHAATKPAAKPAAKNAFTPDQIQYRTCAPFPATRGHAGSSGRKSNGSYRRLHRPLEDA